MGFWSFLNHWWNLPFLVMLGVCAAFVLLQALGLVGAAGKDLEHDLAVDGDAAGAHDADAALAHGADPAHPGAAVAQASGPSLFQDALGFLGAGRVPFMIVWVSLFLCTGFAGILANRVLFVLAGGYSGWWFLPVQAGALVAGVAGAGLAGGVGGGLVEVGGRGATRKHDLTGRLGVVASAVCDDRFGEIRVSDERGNELLVHGRLAPGEAPLQRAASVVLVDFDADRDLFSVAACPELEPPKARKAAELQRNP
jgi:hypothetical protein